MEENQLQAPEGGADSLSAEPTPAAGADTPAPVAEAPAAEVASEPTEPGAELSEPAPALPEAEAAPEPEPPTETESEPAPAGEPEPEGSPAEPAADEPGEAMLEQWLGDEQQPAAESESEAAELKAVLEAIVYVLNEPMPARQIAEALGRDVKQVEPMLRQLAEETSRADRGLFIREVAGGYQMATKPEHHEVIATFVKNLKQPLKLSQAALETLAVIAYRQPITMPEILEIRGVQGGGVVKTLIDRKLITTAGRKNVIGKPMLYKTTKDFLTQFGLRDLAELPSLKEFEEIRRQSIADDEIVDSPQQTLNLPPAEAAGSAPTADAEPEQATPAETAPAAEAAPETTPDHE